MSLYTIITDAGCDIPKEVLDGWQVKCLKLYVHFTDCDLPADDMDADTFYDALRAGHTAMTSAINLDGYTKAFREELENGRDVLYLGFSSGLSGTVYTAQSAAKALEEEFPERRVIALDSLCGSVGLGLLTKIAVGLRDNGATLMQVCEQLESVIPYLCHWFTVDDLMHLKRGGRLKPTAAILGTVLNIKPVLHMDHTGHLVATGKVRGRKAAIRALAEKYDTLHDSAHSGFYAISYGGCLEDDAYALQELMQTRTSRPPVLLYPIGPVIGAHSGPGTLALYFIGKER